MFLIFSWSFIKIFMMCTQRMQSNILTVHTLRILLLTVNPDSIWVFRHSQTRSLFVKCICTQLSIYSFICIYSYSQIYRCVHVDTWLWPNGEIYVLKMGLKAVYLTVTGNDKSARREKECKPARQLNNHS